jgi:hypothetical protein
MFNEILVGTQSNTDGDVVKARAGKNGDQLVSGLHGNYYESSRRGQVFFASTVIAGVVVPVAAATLNSKFTLWNTAASGVNVELISVFMMTDNATTVVGTHGLLVQRALASSGGIPTTVTTPCIALPAGLGSVSSGVSVNAQATLTNAQIPSVATAPYIGFWPIGGYGATTAAGGADLTHDFNGKLVLGPDSLVALVTSVAASSACFCSICWAEYPV